MNFELKSDLNRKYETKPLSPKLSIKRIFFLITRFAAHPNRKFLANNNACGVKDPNLRIVNGEEAEIGEFPWLANLGYTVNGRKNVEFKCGGALIGDQYVITAAHCVTQLPGSYNL